MTLGLAVVAALDGAETGKGDAAGAMDSGEFHIRHTQVDDGCYRRGQRLLNFFNFLMIGTAKALADLDGSHI